MVGLEIAASVAQLVLIDSGKSTWQRLEEVLSTNPARIAHDEGHGQIKVGQPANVAVIDPTKTRLIAEKTASKSINNPYTDHSLPGEVVHTIYRGRFTVLNGQLQKKEEIA
jgi:dihydroorotase